MSTAESAGGRLVLVVCNVSGMVDLVALPLWVGALMQSRGLDAQSAGMMVTTYILGVFGGSLFFAPRLGRISSRLCALAGFGTGAAAFFGLAFTEAVGPMLILHALAGIGAGCGLSFTHGTIGRSHDPHRVFGLCSFGTGVFAIAFFATLPAAIAAHGASALFVVLAGLLAIASVLAAIGFPTLNPPRAGRDSSVAVSFAVRALAFLGVACLATTQAMIFSFIERVGIVHGFTPAEVGTMLVVGGFVNLTAPIAAALLDRRVSHLKLAIGILPVHAAFGALAVLAPSYIPYAVCAIIFVWLIIFGHNFMFSLIAALDPSGRTVASTPAMLMIGSAIGPILGGTLVQSFGYPSLAVAAPVIAAMGCGCFLAIAARSRRSAMPAPTTASPLPGVGR
jgi:predicted MFS family arabinose efflux permease